MEGYGVTRMIGNTTRLVDYYIQLLFTKKEITVRDHHDNNAAHLELFNRIINRMESEHGRLKLEIHKSNLTIKLDGFKGNYN